MQLKSIELLRMVLGVVNCSDTFETLQLLLSRLAEGENLNCQGDGETFITISIPGTAPTTTLTAVTINRTDFF